MKIEIINGNSYVEYDIVLAPVKRHHATFELDGRLSLESPNLTHKKPHELYILSDEEIKEGDWCYIKWSTNVSGKDLFEVAQCTKIGPAGIHYFDKMSMCWGKHELSAKKIVATTDESINEILQGETFKQLIPEISKSFVQYFVNEYNLSNVITKVLVEHHPIVNDNTETTTRLSGRIKTNLNNEIHILISTGMRVLRIYEFQAKQIEHTLRQVKRVLYSESGETSLDRDIIQSLEIIKNIVKGDIDMRVLRRRK